MTGFKSTISRDLRNRRFWQGLSTHGLAAIGAISAVLCLFALFFPDALSGISHWWLLVVVGAAVGYAIRRSWPYPVAEHYSAPDTTVRLITGDLFEQNVSLVIGMADCFDIEVPHIIARNSVQGQFLDRVYRNDVPTLRSDLAAGLSGKQIVETGVQKKGNTDRYDLGTVATISHQRTNYYCLAYTTMDENSNVSSSIGTLWSALEQLWQEVRAKSNGEPVAIPIIGLGQSGMSTVLPIQDAVRFIILSFVFASRQHRVCDELRIIVRPQDERRIDMLEMQDFLHSLRRYA